MYRQLNC